MAYRQKFNPRSGKFNLIPTSTDEQIIDAVSKKHTQNTDTAFVKNDGTVSLENLVKNGSFELWSAGDSSAPDGWTGPGAWWYTVEKESTIVRLGTYSAKLTLQGHTGIAIISQNIHLEKGLEYWKGKKVTISCWVWCATGARARIGINVGTTIYGSGAHSGDSQWQLLKSSATIPINATMVAASIQILYSSNPSTVSAYFDGVMVVEGESAFSFTDRPLSSINDIDDAVSKKHTQNLDTALRTNKLTVDESGNTEITGELKIKVYSQDEEPTLGADQRLAIWIDTDDNYRTYLIFRRNIVESGLSTQVKTELL